MGALLRVVRGLDRRLCLGSPIALVLLVQAGLLAALAPYLLRDDSWLTLVAGREIWRHGIPSRDVLAAWTAGRPWIDQQWLAQSLFYAAERAGGLPTVFALHLAALTAALGLAAATARRRGASGLAIFVIALMALLVAPWSWQPRSQSLAEVLYVVLLALLLREPPERPSRRVLLVVPVLALWANLHGSALIGVAVVLGYALVGLAAQQGRGLGARQRRIHALLLLSPLCLLITPYGLRTAGYYRAMLGKTDLAALAPEWRAPHGWDAVQLLLLVVVAVSLVAACRRRVGSLELVLLTITLAASLVAVRFSIWFALAAVMILPPLLQGEATRGRVALARCLGWGCAAGLVAVAALLLAEPSTWYERNWPDRAGHALAGAAERDPAATIFVHGHEADWLLWVHPSLSGRIAYDARLELLSNRQIREIVAFDRRSGPSWTAAVDSAGYVWINSQLRPQLASALARQPGLTLVYRDREITLLRRAASRPDSSAARDLSRT